MNVEPMYILIRNNLLETKKKRVYVRKTEKVYVQNSFVVSFYRYIFVFAQIENSTWDNFIVIYKYDKKVMKRINMPSKFRQKSKTYF